jgi:hypothetical protein
MVNYKESAGARTQIHKSTQKQSIGKNKKEKDRALQ